MSINFNDPMNDEQRKIFAEFIMDKIIPTPIAQDEYGAIFDRELVLKEQELAKLANSGQQEVTIQAHEQGEIKEMSDGTKYRVTPQGWRKITY